MQEHDTRVSGTRCGDHRKASKSFGAGRTCVTEGCDTQLSMYNPDNRCAVHAKPLITGHTGATLRKAS